ncbi:cytochrome P450 3A5-like [Haliotis cracherodii]|uniref:cytochrome P450 3A5-like n=1 Tax=Haliotis cracherodii TaxID=6455 RepID=UPI0039E82EFB
MDMLGILDVPLYVPLAVAAALFLYIYGTRNHTYFKTQGIPGPPPYPLIGNITGIRFFHALTTWKQQFGNVFGVFQGAAPCFVISDLDILKEVFVKSFSVFENRKKMPLVPYPLNLGVFFLEGAPWKRVRRIITPTFSSGKLRRMCNAINDCAGTLTRNFSKVIGKQDGVNMKEYFGAFTMDVISRTAFGIKVDSQNDFNNPFVDHAKQMFQPPKFIEPMILLNNMLPALAALLTKLGLGLFSQSITSFFDEAIMEMIKQRQNDSKEKREQRTDFLQLLMDAEIGEAEGENGHVANGKHSVGGLSTDEIVGQGTLFFNAGYETTASTLNFASHHLATNPDVQEEAYTEMKEILGDEEPNFDNIGKLKYLDNIITETLRICPPVFVIHRRASETIQIKGLTIHQGQTVIIPVLALQRDPQLFKDPNSFKPERHDEKSNPLSFLAFGYGPRICIGMRLALVETKIALVHVLRRVKFERMPNTKDELTFKQSVILTPAEDIVLKISPRF